MRADVLRLFFSIHAIDMISERDLSTDWAVRALADPDVVEPDPKHPKAAARLQGYP